MIFRPKVFAAPSGSSEATSTSAGPRPRTESRTAPPTTYAGNGTARSRGKRCIRDSRHDIAESADPLDLDLDLVAPAQGAHSGRRAGQDQVARRERHDRRDELDDDVAGEDHLSGIAVLADHAVDPGLQREAHRLDLGVDAWANRAERVEALSASELHIFLLQIARGDVVRASEPQHVVAP